MDAVYSDKLRKRQQQIQMTLRHVNKQRREVEENTQWASRAAYETRVDLLERLVRCYREENSRIERALERADGTFYGLCLACHEPIEAERLNSCSEVEYCFECQQYRDILTTSRRFSVPSRKPERHHQEH